MKNIDQVREQITQELLNTEFECSSLTRLPGGTANFVYRGRLSSTGSSIIIKHTKGHLASNPNFKLDVTRCHYEEAVLQALVSVSPYSQGHITAKSPHLFHFNRVTYTQVLEDLPNSLDLKNYLLSEVSHGLTRSSANSLGCALGGWLRSFHNWTIRPEQKELKTMIDKNAVMKQLKFDINYTMLVDTIQVFPMLLEKSRDTFEEVRELAATELKRQDCDEDYGIIHGDFWTGNVLVPNVPLTEHSETKVLIVDWELTHVGSRALDLGQMIAELYETKLFKNLEAGVWIIEGFLEGYGSLSDESAFRTAIHVGVHLVCFGSRVPGWGSPQQIEEVVKIGRDLIVSGWTKKRAWFEGSPLRGLFKS